MRGIRSSASPSGGSGTPKRGRSLREGGFTLAELLAAAAALVMIGALVVTVAVRAKRSDALAVCRENLRQLHGALQGSLADGTEHPTGRELWRSLLRDGRVKPGALRCPLLEDGDHGPDVQYYGPAGQIAAAGAGDPIACDDPGNHSADGRKGGNILRKSGDVILDDTFLGETALWASTLKTYCKP